MAETFGTYQGGGDIVLSGQVGGVFNAFQQSQLRKEALAREENQKQEKRQDVFLNELATTMAKVPSKGLQQKDIPGFQEIYTKMQDAYVGAQRATTSADRLLKMAEMKQLATEATVYTQQSEALGKKKSEAMKVLQTQYDKYRADEALQALNSFYDKPLKEVTGDFDILNYRHTYDSKGIDKALDDVQKGLLSSTRAVPTETLVGSTRNGYDTVNTFQAVRAVPQAEAVAGLTSRYNTDQNFKRYVDTEFDGPLDSKLTQLYQNLGPTWGREVKNTSRTAGRAPQRSSGGSAASTRQAEQNTAAAGSVATNVDISYAGNNVLNASKQTSLKGDGLKARLGKAVRAYDLDTGAPINISSDIQDGTITEFVNVTTGDLRGGGRRPLVKGTESRFQGTTQQEDFAVVNYRKPIYVSAEDKSAVFNGTPEQIRKGVANKSIVRSGYEEKRGLFPMDAVLPNAASRTKGENTIINQYKATPVGQKRTSSVLSNIPRR